MNPRDGAIQAQNMPREIPSEVLEETGENRPSLAEIRQRALEIHAERGGDASNQENYLEDWLKAEGELREKYHKSSG